MDDPRVISDQDLDVVETERLIDALFRRAPSVLVAIEVHPRGSPPGQQGTVVRWKNRHSAVGLAWDSLKVLGVQAR